MWSETKNLLAETCDDMESNNKSVDNSTIPPWNSEENMDAMSSGNAFDAESISMEMLEYNSDGNQYHPSVKRIETCYNICDRIKKIQPEWKRALLSTQNMDKCLH